MARNIHGSYHEDNYNKQECQSCKRCFIVGQVLSQNTNLACPYCQSKNIELTAAATEECTEDMDMGCIGLYFHLYDDGQLMLYTEHEFMMAMNYSIKKQDDNGIPLGSVTETIKAYCIKRDGK